MTGIEVSELYTIKFEREQLKMSNIIYLVLFTFKAAKTVMVSLQVYTNHFTDIWQEYHLVALSFHKPDVQHNATVRE